MSQSDVAGYVDFHTDHSGTCTKLSDLSFFGTVIDVPSEYIESADYTYLLLFAKGTTPGQGARSMIFLDPTATSTNTKIDAPTGCGMLDFSADLASLTKLAVPAAGPWILDWRDVTRDGQGSDVPFQKIDGVTLGFYAGMTVADLQARIFDIELIATTLWDVEAGGGPHRGFWRRQKTGRRAPSSPASVAPTRGRGCSRSPASGVPEPGPGAADHPRADRGRLMRFVHGRHRMPLAGSALAGALVLGACGGAPDARQPTDVVATLSDQIATVVIVRWTTSVPATGYVEYGPTQQLGARTAVETTASLDHTAVVLGLKADAPAYFRAVSADNGAPVASSGVESIRTGVLPVGLPALTQTGAATTGSWSSRSSARRPPSSSSIPGARSSGTTATIVSWTSTARASRSTARA